MSAHIACIDRRVFPESRVFLGQRCDGLVEELAYPAVLLELAVKATQHTGRGKLVEIRTDLSEAEQSCQVTIC